jgi:DNA primase
MSQTEEIKAKLDIVEVIREYVPIKAVGANFQALCPFHNEKSPSFIISPDKQIWHCFGCSRGGDVFSFVMEREGMDFPEALRFLAAKAGVILKHENQEHYTKRNRLLDIMELSGKYYEHCLKSDSGRQIRQYLIGRGLDEKALASWRIGYSPDSWEALYTFLKARPLIGKKFSDEEIFAAGLIIKKDSFGNGSGRGYYDRFRDRIMFPIWDINNNIVAFTARVNPEKELLEKMGKYINSPQTELYDKSRLLFALNKAKDEIKKKDLAIVVEGQMDAIACHNHGLKNVVASSGTALTKEQVLILKRFSKNIALVFDMDIAGQMAADRGIKECLAQGLDVKIITLPSGKDPDESLRNNPGEMERGAFLAASRNESDFENYYKKPIENAKSILEYYFEKVSVGLNLQKLDDKKVIRDKMLAMIALVPDKTEQGYWLKKLSDDLGFAESDMREEFGRRQKIVSGSSAATGVKVAEISSAMLEKTREERLSELFLALILKAPEFLSYSANNLEPEYLIGDNLALFYNKLIIYYNKTGDFNYDNLKIFLTNDDKNDEDLLRRLSLLGEKDFYDYEPEQMKAQIIDIISELKKYSRHRRLERLHQEISQAETGGNQEALAQLMEELKRIMDLN